jgi:hypothetical protein
MKLWFGIAAIVLGLSAPAFAYDDPKALVDAIYAPYTTLGAAKDQDPAQYYSERLRGLVAANAAPQGENPPPVLEFNPFIGAKQALLRDLAISALAHKRGRRVEGRRYRLARRRRELVTELAPSVRSVRHQIGRVASFSQAFTSDFRLGPISRRTRL